ncbi:hypothetical protein F4861DRAFT_520978 [Xylaria intraflava]|nr:hypothetical protein F4861DRAFT_520978 [Xylaria intraflava]
MLAFTTQFICPLRHWIDIYPHLNSAVCLIFLSQSRHWALWQLPFTMAHEKCSFPTRSVADDEESLTAGLLDSSSSTRVKRHRSAKSTTLFRLYMFVVHAALLTLTLVVIHGIHPYWKADREVLPGSTWSPIQQFVEYEVRGRDTHGHQRVKKYEGPPTPEKDKDWDHLIKPAYFNATFEDLVRAGESLENVTQLTGGGYLASIGVYHELHCVRQLRFYIYKERYYPNLSEKDERYLQIHLDHCVEALRETIMCSGNTALISFYWENPDSSQPAAKSNARSTCARWDSIERWGSSRMVSTSPDFVRPEI